MRYDSILLIEPFLPWPLISGGHQAMYNGIKAMAPLFGKIYLIFKTDPVQDLNINMDSLKREVPNVESIPYININKKEKRKESIIKRCLRKIYHTLWPENIQKPDPAKALYSVNDFPETYLTFIREKIVELKISIVQVEFPWMISLVDAIPENIKTVFVHHEIGFVRNELMINVWGHNAYRDMAVRVNKDIEIALLNKYDAIITLSEIDRQKLIEAGVKSPVYSSIAVVNIEDIPPMVVKSRKIISFVGPQQHYPNQDGIAWFLNECWNKLLKKDSSYFLQIIGKWSEATKQEITDKYTNVKFLGFVPNLKEALEGTTMIVPIRIGSGIRMKILEAASIGIPVVTTSVGVEGLGLIDGKGCFIADRPEEFVDDIIKLENENLRKQFIDSAHQYVLNNYSINVLEKNRKAIYDNILS